MPWTQRDGVVEKTYRLLRFPKSGGSVHSRREAVNGPNSKGERAWARSTNELQLTMPGQQRRALPGGGQDN